MTEAMYLSGALDTPVICKCHRRQNFNSLITIAKNDLEHQLMKCIEKSMITICIAGDARDARECIFDGGHESSDDIVAFNDKRSERMDFEFVNVVNQDVVSHIEAILKTLAFEMIPEGQIEINKVYCNLYSPITMAAHKGCLPVVVSLIKNGAIVNAPNGHGETSLFLAAEKNHLDPRRRKN